MYLEKRKKFSDLRLKNKCNELKSKNKKQYLENLLEKTHGKFTKRNNKFPF